MKSSKSAAESGWDSYPAELWDRNHPPPLSKEQLRFWLYCAETYGGPILDLCCGNGRYALPLAEQGYEIVGVDINEGMIQSAQRLARETAGASHEVNASFHVGDVVNLDLGRTFRLAIMPGWSFQVLLTQEDQIAFLQRVREHLLPGGAFAFNVFIPFNRQRGLVAKNGVYEWPPDPSYHSGAPRTYDPVSQIETLVESNVHPIELRHTSLSELKLLFRLTGFEVAELYGDDEDMRSFTGKGSEDYTVLAARK